jgi:hypothetical protein
MDRAVRTLEQRAVKPGTKWARPSRSLPDVFADELTGIGCAAGADARARWPKAWQARSIQRGGWS